MVQIEIPLQSKRETFTGDSIQTIYILSSIPYSDPMVYVSGILMTENEDYMIYGNNLEFFEIPLIEENINITYKV